MKIWEEQKTIVKLATTKIFDRNFQNELNVNNDRADGTLIVPL